MSRRAAAAALAFFWPCAAGAAARLDRSFGAGGRVLVSPPVGARAAAGYGVSADEDGLVVAGVVVDSSGVPHMASWRFLSDGKIDFAYGRGGVSLSPEAGWAWSSALDGEGRLLAAGIKAVFGKASAAAVLERRARFGALDAGFGRGGRAEARDPFGGVVVEGGAVASDGREILLAGQASAPDRTMRPTLWRLDEAGAFEGGSSTAAARPLSVPDGVFDARVSALAPRAGGWWAAGALDWSKLALWKLGPDGAPDWNFGAGGLALSSGVGRAVLDDGAGGAWAAGFLYQVEGKAKRERAVLAHFAADGSTVSWASLAAPGLDREAFALARGSDGRLFLAGYADGGKFPVRACVWSRRPDGSADRRFGRDGALILPGPKDGEERVYALGVDSRGRLLAAGLSSEGPGRPRRLAVWRILIQR